MSKPLKQPINQFHVTCQLGFKPVLYCWCGASFDMNQRHVYKALKVFKLAHENVCEPQVSKQTTLK
jgi:hypothetical protein